MNEANSPAMQGVLVTAMGVDGCTALFADAKPIRFEAGQSIYLTGEPATNLILIETGRAEVSNTSLTGRKSVLAHMGPGEILGEIAALDGGLRSADVVAASAIDGRVTARQNLLAFIASRPKIAEAVIIELCRKVRNASEMFQTQSIVEGEARLARSLLRLFDKWGTATEDGASVLAERFSQQDIGEFSGLARENVNRQIKNWVKLGILQNRGRQLVLIDRTTLEVLADS